MPFSAERTDLIKARIESRLSSATLNVWEASYLTNMQTKFDQHDGRTRLSNAQYQNPVKLLDLSAERVIDLVSSNYTAPLPRTSFRKATPGSPTQFYKANMSGNRRPNGPIRTAERVLSARMRTGFIYQAITIC
jgi:hypothetical protein